MTPSTLREAEEIAHLLNTRNHLMQRVSGAYVLRNAKKYVGLTSPDGVVMACAQCKQVQWYQSEVCHVSVHPDYEGRGLGKQVVQEAERVALLQGSILLQATIRTDNERSLGLFAAMGFQRVSEVFNPASGNRLVVLQKPLYR